MSKITLRQMKQERPLTINLLLQLESTDAIDYVFECEKFLQKEIQDDFLYDFCRSAVFHEILYQN